MDLYCRRGVVSGMLIIYDEGGTGDSPMRERGEAPSGSDQCLPLMSMTFVDVMYHIISKNRKPRPPVKQTKEKITHKGKKKKLEKEEG